MTVQNFPIDLEPLRELAYRAHYNISFAPDKRADYIVALYTQELREDLRMIVDAAPDPFPAEQLLAIQQRYVQKYTDLLRTWLSSLTNTASSAIVGPSNFPSQMMQKRQRWAETHKARFRDWRNRALKAIPKAMQPKLEPLTEARNKLAARQQYQELMTKANALIRKNPANLRGRLSALGLSADEIGPLLIPDYANRKGFKPFQLANNSTEIRRLTERVQQLEDKQHVAETVGNTVEVINGVALVQNYEADRVQIIFPARPGKDTCRGLRKAGFVYSPTNKAWQRHLNKGSYTVAKAFVSQLPTTGNNEGGPSQRLSDPTGI